MSAGEASLSRPMTDWERKVTDKVINTMFFSVGESGSLLEWLETQKDLAFKRWLEAEKQSAYAQRCLSRSETLRDVIDHIRAQKSKPPEPQTLGEARSAIMSAVPPKYRLLQDGDIIHPSCESLGYDAETWEPVDWCWCRSKWNPIVFQPMREPRAGEAARKESRER